MTDNGTVLVAGFSYLLVSQVASRAVTFLLNLVITRLLSPEAYGLAAVQFHLINTVILFLSREGFRRGCLRTPTEGHSKLQTTRRTLATSALCIPIGCVVTLVTCRLAYGWQDAAASYSAAEHQAAVRLQGTAALLELLSEPLYNLAAVQLRFRLRAVVDTAAITAKSAATVALLRLSGLPPALALSWAQMAFAAVTLACYAAAFAGDIPSWLRPEAAQAAGKEIAGQKAAGSTVAPSQRDDTSSVANASADSTLRQRKPQQAHADAATDAAPQSAQPQRLLHGPTLWLCGSFSLQAAEKLVLAEGSKMVMVGAQSATAQGVYGLVVNLGSLVVRTAFQPIEEAAFTAFSTSGVDRRQAAQVLAVLVRSVAIVGLLAAAFGPAYAWLALHLLYGQRWSATEAPAALAAYSSYIALLAVNGILEAVVHASASPRQLVHINVALVAFAAAHMALSVVLVRAAGAVGLIAADSVNMLLRIGFSLAYVRILFAGVPAFRLAALVPTRQTLAALGLALIATGLSAAAALGPIAGGPLARLLALWHIGSRPWQSPGGSSFLLHAGGHIGAGAACLAAVGLTVWRSEGRLWSELLALRRQAIVAATDKTA